MATRFQNGIVVTLGKNNRVIWNGSVVTDGENIVGVGSVEEMKKRYPNADSVDCTNKVVLPGFICAHHHFYSTFARGMANLPRTSWKSWSVCGGKWTAPSSAMTFCSRRKSR
jgi:cytosine/adenosine deaminase-related metal-dependent hydrolase